MANLNDDKNLGKGDQDIIDSEVGVLGENAGAEDSEEENSDDSDWDLESDIEE